MNFNWTLRLVKSHWVEHLGTETRRRAEKDCAAKCEIGRCWKKDCSLNFSWLSKCFKKYSEATSAAIIRLNPSHLSWLRSGAARRREQTSEKRLCMLKTHLKASACAERLADVIVSDCSLKEDFTLFLYHQQPSSADTGRGDGNQNSRRAPKKRHGRVWSDWIKTLSFAVEYHKRCAAFTFKESRKHTFSDSESDEEMDTTLMFVW